MDAFLAEKRASDPILARRRDVWGGLDDLDSEDWLEDSQERDEFKQRVEDEIKRRLNGDQLAVGGAMPVSLSMNVDSGLPAAELDQGPSANATPRPSTITQLKTQLPSIANSSTFIGTAPNVETPTFPRLQSPPRVSRPPTALDTPENVPTPTQTPSADDPTVGRGRRDDPATPVPLTTGGFPSIKSKTQLQTLTKTFELFSKSVAGPSTIDSGRGRGRGRGRGGPGLRSGRPQALLGQAATVFRGLRFCIPPDPTQVSRDKLRWDIIAKHGGQVVLQPDTAITHVIHDSGRSAALLARELDVQSLSDLPEGTVCVKWDWVVQCKVNGRLLDTTPWLSFPKTTLHGALSVGATARSRIVELTENMRRNSSLRRKRAPTPSDSETESSERPQRLSHAQRMVQRLSAAPTSVVPLASSRLQPSSDTGSSPQDRISTRHDLPGGPGWVQVGGDMQDGLDEMITGVVNGSIETHEVEEPGSDGVEDEAGNPNPTADFFKCGQSHTGTAPKGPNEWLACKFDELHGLYEGVQGKNDFAVRGYQRTAGILRRTTYEIKSGAQAKEIKGIGNNMADRIDEFITGAQGRAYYENTEKAQAIATFKDIYGVGKSFANELYRRGARSIEDLKTKDFNLTAGQKLGVELYDDLNSRIPRPECKEIFEAIRESALAIDPKLWVEIMGSYRRGSETSGDVDILITRDTSDGLTHAGVLRRLVFDLHTRGVFTHDLSTPTGWNSLESKWMGVARLTPAHKYRRVDILCIPFEQWGASLIYFTGNEVFNRSLRLYARKKGYSLNQRGLYNGVMRDRTGTKTTEGEIVASRTEEEIFDVLGIRWRPPHQRRP